jgi:hypothetical protein
MPHVQWLRCSRAQRMRDWPTRRRHCCVAMR